MNSTQIIINTLLVIIIIIATGRFISPVFSQNRGNSGIQIKNKYVAKILIGSWRKSNKKWRGFIYVSSYDKNKMTYLAFVFYLIEMLACLSIIFFEFDITIVVVISLVFGLLDAVMYRNL